MATPTAGKDSGTSKGAPAGKDKPAGKDYSSPGVDVARIRTVVARVVWAVFVLFALVLALAALLIALKANEENAFVEFIGGVPSGGGLAGSIDLGIFDLDNPIKAFDGENAATKTALFNYGIGAVVYLIVGRILERIIRA